MLKGPSYLEKSMTTATKQLSDGNAAFRNQPTNVLNGFDVFFNANQLGQLRRLVKNAAQNTVILKLHTRRLIPEFQI